jgi:hypothetical protein
LRSKVSFLKEYHSLPWQKVEMHLHTKEDVLDGPDIDYTIFDFLDLAAKDGYTIVCWTNHYRMPDRATLEKARVHAQKKGVLLVPGVEHEINGRDVLLYFDYDIDHNRIIHSIKTFRDIKRLADKGVIRLVGAPHPFFPIKGLQHMACKHKDIFHFFELNWFYAKTWLPDYFFNRNRIGVKFARKHRIPVLAGGDLHFLDEYGKDYTNLRCQKNLDSFYSLFQNMKDLPLTNREIHSLVRVHSRPLSFISYVKYTIRMLLSFVRFFYRQIRGIRAGKV